jgi:hypothetical protein
MEIQIPAQFCARIRQSANRPHLLVGCEPTALMLALVLCIIVGYPMTRTLIKREWHRVYAFDAERKVVTAVRLLVRKDQDPGLFLQNPEASAWPRVRSISKSGEPLAWGEATE